MTTKNPSAVALGKLAKGKPKNRSAAAQDRITEAARAGTATYWARVRAGEIVRTNRRGKSK